MRVTRSIVRPFTVAAAVLALGVLASCSGESGPAPAPSTPSSVAAPSTAPPPSSSASTAADPSAGPSAQEQPTESFGLLQAIAAARKAGAGAVTAAELSRFGETSAWQVTVRQSRTVTVEVVVTNDGKVQNRTKGDTGNAARTAPGSEASAAIKAAQARVEGQATSVELDEEGGQRVWRVTISRPGDQPLVLTYDADSGKFLR